MHQQVSQLFERLPAYCFHCCIQTSSITRSSPDSDDLDGLPTVSDELSDTMVRPIRNETEHVNNLAESKQISSI